MTIFQSLPPSVLQAGAIFLSIMIEALPFVLIGSLISGLIEVYITPDKVYEFPKAEYVAKRTIGLMMGAVTRKGTAV